MLLRSPRLAALPNVRHGFSTRLGGVSQGPFAGLNLGFGTEDPPAHVVVNRQRFLRALAPAQPLTLVQVEQVHGTEVLAVGGPITATPLPRADGLLSLAPGLALGVRTADCAPLLFAAVQDGHAYAVAAVHAGWRGAVQGILHTTVESFRAHGFRPEQLVAAVGPMIGIEDFEVGDEVVDEARRALGGAEPRLLRGPRGRWHLDLRALIDAQLERLGVHHRDHVGGNTVSDRGLYYSHRRDQGRTGRHLSAIARQHSPAPGAALGSAHELAAG